MSRTARFLTGVRFGYVTQVLTTAVGLWLTPFLLRHLGTVEYGLWLTISQILSYLLLLDVGIIAMVPREVARATGRTEGRATPRAVGDEVGRALFIVMLQLPIIALAAWATWRFLPAQWDGARGALGAVLLIFVLCYPFRLSSAVLEGLQDFRATGRIQLATWVAQVIVSVVLVARGAGLEALVWGWGVQQVASALLLAGYLWRRHRAALPAASPRMGRAMIRQRFARGGWISMGQVATVLESGTDLLIIAQLLGPAAVVPYDITRKLIVVLQNQPQLLMHVATPALSQLRASGDRARLARVVGALGLGLLWVSGAVTFVVTLLNQAFIAWWVGPERFGGQALTVTLLVAMFARHSTVATSYANFSLGRERDVAIISLTTGVVSVLAGAVLVRLVGPIGAPFGALIGLLFVSGPMGLRILAQELRETPMAMLRPLLPLVARVAALVAAAALVARVWTPRGFLLLAATGAVAGAVYLLVMIPVVLRSSLAYWVVPRLPERVDRLLRFLYGSQATVLPEPSVHH